MMALCHDINFLQRQYPTHLWIHLQDIHYQGSPFPAYISRSTYLLHVDLTSNPSCYQMLITHLILCDYQDIFSELFFHLSSYFASPRSFIHSFFTMGTIETTSYSPWVHIMSICRRVKGILSTCLHVSYKRKSYFFFHHAYEIEHSNHSIYNYVMTWIYLSITKYIHTSSFMRSSRLYSSNFLSLKNMKNSSTNLTFYTSLSSYHHPSKLWIPHKVECRLSARHLLLFK